MLVVIFILLFILLYKLLFILEEGKYMFELFFKKILKIYDNKD